MAFENTTRLPDFQADYEGSIPVTRFNRDFVYRSLAGPPSPARRGI
jgi:hypothetical protein